MSFEKITPDDIIYPGKNKWKKQFKNFPYSFLIAGLLIVVFLVGGLFYTIGTNEVGVVLRLGKFQGITQPGLHLKLPLGIDKVHPVKVEYIYKEEFGFRTRQPGIRTAYESKSFDEESLMLTGDLNVLDLEWIVQFKVKDPFNVLFNIRDARQTLRDISESVMRKIVGDYSFNEVLTTKRLEINGEAQKRLQDILDSYDAGIQIVTVKLQDVNPPDQVKPAFNEVNEAKQEKEKLVNQAWEIYNQKIPQAKGEALKIVKKAEGYAAEKINNAAGDAGRFTLIWESYTKAKEITRTRLYLEEMDKMYQNAGEKYIIDPTQKGILPLLKLGNEK
ncbi:MAG: FtsH protease activity modulator HflK [Candidatus Omnitrophica bacterium]|nr:FtsH protease activity modulator HflK [Candidatus Omnitrophota bacterium]